MLIARNAAARALLGEDPAGPVTADPVSEAKVFVGPYPSSWADTGADEHFDCAVLRGDGSLVPVRGAARVLEAEDGAVRLITLVALGSGESVLAGEGSFVAALLDAAPEALALTRGGRVVYVNHEFTRLFGFEKGECLGQCLDDLLTPEDQKATAETIYREVQKARRASAETVRCSRSGERLDVSLLIGPVEVGGGEPGLLFTFRDIRELKRAEAELEFRALHDTLTGLANRALLQDRLQQGLKRLKREPDRGFAVLYLDLDGFKATNDTLGHEPGDQLLQRVARALRDCVRPQDTVARMGGDEFALLLESTGSAESARVVADRVLRAIEASAVEESLPVSASIGVVLVTEPGGTADRILRQADVAMYHAKAAGKGRSMIYEPGMSMSRRGGAGGM